ncbi:MAG TPA: ABC transporter permease [Gemmatimonadaceae bacterium]|nr:ABC transporter permease [Gemmatimonadaceae bacterium]
MSWLDALRHRLRPLVHPDAYDRELQEEFTLHRALDAAQQRDAADAEAAAHAARLRFGSPTVHREETRRMTILGWLDVLRQDARYGWRALVRAPAFTAVAVLSLALGIGANTVIFGLVYSLLLEPLPLPHPERLIALQRVDASSKSGSGFQLAEFEELRRASGAGDLTTFSSVLNVLLEVGEQRDYATVNVVEGRYFQTIGLRAQIGRLITPDDDRSAAPVVVISDSTWARFFNRSRSALGQTITLRGNTFTIVGVTPAPFQGLVFPGHFELAVPMGAGPLIGLAGFTGPRAQPLLIVGRLSNAAAITGAKAALDNVFRACCASGQLAGAAKAGGSTSRLNVIEISHGIPFGKVNLRAEYARILVVLMAGVAVVLLIACANVGNLVLARSAARSRELAVRLAMGASRGRIVRQLLTEGAQLAVLGGAMGFLLAAWGTRLLLQSLPGNLGAFSDIVAFHPKPALLAFNAAVSLACVLVFGLVPALRATRTDLISPLKDRGESRGGRRAGALDRALVVAQVSLALLLVSSAGLLAATLRNLRNIDGGFATTHVLLASVDTRGTSYERAGIVPLYPELLERVRRMNGVRAAAASSTSPVFGGRWSTDLIDVPGYAAASGEDMAVPLNAVSAGYFEAAGIRLLSGRDFTASDGPRDQKVVVISETMARAFWPARDPVGATIRIGTDSAMELRVIGVAKDAKYLDQRAPAEKMMYVPLVQSGDWPFVVITARTAGEPQLLAAQLTREVRAFVPELRVRQLLAMEQAIDQSLERERLAAGLAALFGVLALSLAAVGLYGVVSYGVTRRTAEIGIRMALGARATSVVWFVLRNSFAMVMLGVAIGAPLTFLGGRAIAALLYGVGAHDPLLLAGAALLLTVTAGLASAIPAMRAARIDPLKALRAD